MNALLERQAKLQDAIDAAGGWELERKLEIAADALRLPPWEASIGTLSGGEKRRVALCRLLLSAPDMLLLDEPTNHLDAESIAWLERYLEEYPSTVIAVTHDRYFLDNVAEWILELDRGHGIPWHGNYSSWLEQKEQRLALEEREREALRKTLAHELEWVRQNPKARQAKSKARLQRYEELASREFQERNETNEIYIPPGERLGDLVIESKGLRKGYGERLLIDNLSFNLPRGGIVGIIGPNGAGKTTLFRMLTGAETAGRGRDPHRARPCKLAYVDQSRQTLDDKKTVWQEISGGLDIIKVGNYETPSRGYVGRFNFKGTQQQQPIGELSGGERNRVHLAKVLRVRRQRAAARRADQRPGHRDAARAGGGAAQLPGLRGGDLARSLVPRPHRHAHPRLRGRLAGGVVRGQLPGVRRGLQAPQGRGSRAAAPHQVQAPDALKGRAAPLSRPANSRAARRSGSSGLWRWVGPLAALVVFVAVAVVLHRQFAHLHVRSIFAHLHAIPRRQILAALAFTALSYWLLTTYELLALRYLRRAIAYARILFTSFIAYSFGHALGFAGFTGSAIRFRLYATAGITAIDVATVTAFCSLSLGIGLATVSGRLAVVRARALRAPAASASRSGRCWSVRCCWARWPPTVCGRAWRAARSRSAAGRCARPGR